jgi:magnesium transporter
VAKDTNDKIDRALGYAAYTMGKGARILGSTLGLPGVSRASHHRVTPGEVPGIEHLADIGIAPEPGTVEISFIDYSETRVESGQINDLDAFLETPRPDWVTVRWINVSNTHPYVVNLFREHFEFHTLTAEDVLHIPQRPRIEFFDDHVFVVLRMLQLMPPSETSGVGTLSTEQVSLFLYGNVLITFQEKPGDVWQPIRDRLQSESKRIRKSGAGYLLYSLLDAVVDHCFPVLERYGDLLEDRWRNLLQTFFIAFTRSSVNFRCFEESSGRCERWWTNSIVTKKAESPRPQGPICVMCTSIRSRSWRLSSLIVKWRAGSQICICLRCRTE